MIEWLADPQIWASLVTLTLLEIVLGIDNIIFLALIVTNLPESQQATARKIGLALAFIFRIALLFSITIIIGMTKPVVTMLGFSLSWRDIILLAGGLFLIFKATQEIHKEIEEVDDTKERLTATHGFLYIITQIAIIDLVFSIDSIITAIGIAGDNLAVMITAIVISMIMMYVAAEGISGFIKRHPTIKMLALSFLIMIGAVLIADGLHFHVPRGYIYAAMGFAMLVEFLNMLTRRNRQRKNLEAADPEMPGSG